MTTRTSHHHPSTADWGVPVGLSIGAGLGLIVGLLIDQLAVGMIVGAAVGLITGLLATSARDVPAPRRRLVVGTAIGILIAGLVAVAYVLLG